MLSLSFLIFVFFVVKKHWINFNWNFLDNRDQVKPAYTAPLYRHAAQHRRGFSKQWLYTTEYTRFSTHLNSGRFVVNLALFTPRQESKAGFPAKMMPIYGQIHGLSFIIPVLAK